MDRVLNYLRSEPLRVRAYALTLLVVGYLLARGVVSATDSEFIGSLAALLLAVETSRAKVTPAIEPGHDHDADFDEEYELP